MKIPKSKVDGKRGVVFRDNSERADGFAVLFLPDFALQASMRMEDLEGQASVLMEEIGRKVVAVQMNAKARNSGVVLGMTVSQVLARSPEAIVRRRSPQGEELARELLVAAAFTFSPRVEETAEGICTIDLTGVPREGRIARAEGLVEELGRIGLVARVGFGSHPLLAFFAAKRAKPVLAVANEKEFLAGLPLEDADPPSRIREILHQWGVHTLGALAALPREEIANRLGEEGIALWDRANGRGERVLRLTVLPEKFEETIELEEGLERLEPLLFLLRRLLGQLTLRLAANWKVAEEVKLTLGLSDESSCERVFRLPEPSRNPELLFRMLHTYLEEVRTDYPIVKIDLWMKPCAPVVKQSDLFESTIKDVHSFADTLARLATIVGPENVGSPRLEPTHRPDAFRLEPLADVGAYQKPAERQFVDSFEKPPLRRYRPPVPARVWLEKGRPVHLQSVVASGPIQAASGPWRLSGNWWEPLRWTRDEWDIELLRGGCYRLVREQKAWFVEGEREVGRGNFSE